MLADGNQSATHDPFCGNTDAMMLSFPGLLAKAYLTQPKYILFYLLLTPLWTYVYFLDNALSISSWKHANIQMLCFLSFFFLFFLNSYTVNQGRPTILKTRLQPQRQDQILKTVVLWQSNKFSEWKLSLSHKDLDPS